ncbi:hypothetical protein ABVK25_007405 [Lepraria finkii]|uniref:Uncharacterized protein n=1 Tax=Lepraria finkii TaxID=1340010 RepID=A0ABR4B5S0_9LECA
MDLIKLHAPQYRYSREALDRWIESRSSEYYAVLYDAALPGPLFELVEETIRKQSKEWTEHILKLAEDVARVGKGCYALWKKRQRPSGMLELYERADKKIDELFRGLGVA